MILWPELILSAPANSLSTSLLSKLIDADSSGRSGTLDDWAPSVEDGATESVSLEAEMLDDWAPSIKDGATGLVSWDSVVVRQNRMQWWCLNP